MYVNFDYYIEAKHYSISHNSRVNGQICVRQMLKGSTLPNIMDKESCDVSSALLQLYHTNEAFASQDLLSYCTRAVNVKVLNKTLDGANGTKYASTQCRSHESSRPFQKLSLPLKNFHPRETVMQRNMRPVRGFSMSCLVLSLLSVALSFIEGFLRILEHVYK